MSIGLLLQSACDFSPQKPHNPKEYIHQLSLEPVDTLDPALVNDRSGFFQVGLVYEGLFEYHYSDRPYRLVPTLAEAIPPPLTGENKTISIKIRPGVLFHDDPAFKASDGRGRELIAYDVEYTIKRIAHPATQSPAWAHLQGMILGLEKWRALQEGKDGALFEQKISGLRVVSRYQVDIDLSKNEANFLHLLSMPNFYIVPREAVDYYGEKFGKNPVGTGPYVLNKRHSDFGKRFTWDRNPTYHAQGALPKSSDAKSRSPSGVLPRNNGLVYHMNVGIDQESKMLKASELDILSISSDRFNDIVTPAKNLDKKYAQKGYTLVKAPRANVTMIVFNLKHPLFDSNTKLRAALSLGFEVDNLIKQFYGGRALRAQGPVPPGVDGYDAKFKNVNRSFNLSRAKKLLRESGYPDGNGLPELIYQTPEGSPNRVIAEYFKRVIERIGVKIKIEQLPWDKFDQSIASKSSHLWAYSWEADYPDAENFLRLYYSGHDGKRETDSGYHSRRYNQLYASLVRTSKQSERRTIIRQMQEILAEDVPAIWGVHTVDYLLVHQRVRDYQFHEFGWSAPKYFGFNQNGGLN